MTTKELWDSKTPEERRLSLDNLLINTTLQKVNPCSSEMCQIGYQYSIDQQSFIVFKIQHDKSRNINYAFSKSI